MEVLNYLCASNAPAIEHEAGLPCRRHGGVLSCRWRFDRLDNLVDGVVDAVTDGADYLEPHAFQASLQIAPSLCERSWCTEGIGHQAQDAVVVQESIGAGSRLALGVLGDLPLAVQF